MGRFKVPSLMQRLHCKMRTVVHEKFVVIGISMRTKRLVRAGAWRRVIRADFLIHHTPVGPARGKTKM